jgi:hypothetical protein
LVTSGVGTAFYNTLTEEGKSDGKTRYKTEQLLDDLQAKRGYCKLKEEALDRTVWRTGFGRFYGRVVRQTVE